MEMEDKMEKHRFKDEMFSGDTFLPEVFPFKDFRSKFLINQFP